MRLFLTLFLTLILAMICAAPARAAGFYIQEQSVSGLGTAFAGSAAMPRDASIIYYNPAGMTALEGTQGYIAMHVIAPRTSMKDTGSTIGGAAVSGGDGGNPYSPSPVPNLYLSHQLAETLWIGIGVSFPFGLGNEYNDGWFGRYDSTRSELTTTDIQPSIAIKLNDRLSIGGGVNIQSVTGLLENAINDGVEGLQTLDGDAITAGYTLGMLVQATPTTTLGANYRSEMRHDLDGRVRVVGTATSDFDVPVSAQLNLPDMATFSIAQKITDDFTLLASANWFGWNDFEKIQPISDAGTVLGTVTQNYQATWAYAAGAEYRLDDAWMLRAGYQFDDSPVTDEYRNSRTPDGDRHWFAAGATYKTEGGWAFDMAATYITLADEEINITRNSGTANVRADTSGDVGIVSFGVAYKF